MNPAGVLTNRRMTEPRKLAKQAGVPPLRGAETEGRKGTPSRTATPRNGVTMSADVQAAALAQIVADAAPARARS